MADMSLLGILKSSQTLIAGAVFNILAAGAVQYSIQFHYTVTVLGLNS